MKKITLLLALLTISLGYSQVALPFDFSTLPPFIDNTSIATLQTDPGDSDEAADPSNGVLQIDGQAGVWDNIEVTFTTRVDLSNSATNSISFRIKPTLDYGVRTHLFKFVDGANGAAEIEGFFNTEAGTEWQDISIDYDDAPQSPPGDYGKLVIFTDAGSTNQGVYLIDDISAPEAAPETCSDGIENQDETGVDCGGVCVPCDVTAPTGFTATIGTVGAFSIELLLTATDETSANITYDIAGDVTAQTIGASGVETSYIISGLTPETLYSFDVSASDASGNPAANNAINVGATTIADSSNECTGFTTETTDGAYQVGLNYNFVTEANGTDVTITAELLDTDKIGVVAEVFIEPSTFIGMTNTNAPGFEFETTLTGQTGDITFSIRMPYAGGLVRSKEFTYTVGEDCVLSIDDAAKTSFKIFPNPTQNSWMVKTQSANMSSIKVFDVLGKSVLSISPKGNEAIIDGATLNKGLYFAKIKTESGRTSSLKLIKQ